MKKTTAYVVSNPLNALVFELRHSIYKRDDETHILELLDPNFDIVAKYKKRYMSDFGLSYQQECLTEYVNENGETYELNQSYWIFFLKKCTYQIRTLPFAQLKAILQSRKEFRALKKAVPEKLAEKRFLERKSSIKRL
jgi:hypothetical protein